MMLIQLAVVALLCLGLSHFGSVPYLVTLYLVAGLAVLGHLVHIGEDMPSEDGSSIKQWRLSKLEFVGKLAALAALIMLMVVFPGLRTYGS